MAREQVSFTRRSFLFMAAATTAALSVRPDQAWGATTSTRLQATRLIALHAQWSDERFVGPYMESGSYLPDALAEIAHLYRDRHNQTVHRIDVRVLDLLYDLRLRTGYRGSIEVVCGYRSPETNRMLRRKDRHVAKDSLHVTGQAIDVRFDQGLDLSEAHATALAMRAGGVGYYPRQKFMHLDIGPVRTW
jgi:uncharacterized protein YcbK (DUF882 family)